MNIEHKAISPGQEEYLFQTLPYIHTTIYRKLGVRYYDAVDDLKQKVFLKLWQWKTTRSDKDLSKEEWHKLANVVTRNEMSRFFSEKYNRDVLFSQMDESIQEAVFSIESLTSLLEGNSNAEINSMLAIIWKSAQILTLRQKYAFVLAAPNLILELVLRGFCNIEELAAFFEATEEEIAELLDACPVPDEKIGRLLAAKLGEEITPKKIWEARSKAKARIAPYLKDYIPNERLSVHRRT